MKSKLLFACCLIGLASSACVDDPSDDKTGIAPGEQIFKFDAETSRSFLSEELGASNALQAEFTVVGEAGARLLVPVQVAGEFPESAGADADLQGGIGFGTYPNDRSSSVWTEDAFASTLTAELVLTKPGDAIKFCRSFATTCVNVQLTAEGGLAVLTLAANVPDTEIGEIAPGVSASIRGTGADGLTIAVADPTVLARPFALTAGTPMTLEWRIARGAMEGSIKYSVSVNGTELASGDTATALASSITKLGGVAMQFDAAGDVKTEVDYSYAFNGVTGNFEDPFAALGVDVAVSPQAGLSALPLLVYPTLNPGIPILTLSGNAGSAYSPSESDAVLGAIAGAPASGEPVTVVSAPFNGDDFADTALAGAVDQGIAGGGFYPSPAFCYAQIYPLVNAQVRAGVRKEVHRAMYAAIANGVAQADAALPLLSGALQGEPFNVPAEQVQYTQIGDSAGYIEIGTDYADSNVDTNITTSVEATYEVMLGQPVSQTFRDQLSGIIGVMEANDNAIRNALIQNGALTPEQFANLKRLQVGLTTPPGVKDGQVDDTGTPVVDDPASGICNGYDCNVAVVFADKINGTNVSGENNPAAGGNPAPLLAHVCLWGQPASPAQDATPATLTGDLDVDAPAYAAVPAQPAVPPVREQAAAQLNQLVMGVYGNFITQVFGPPVPASNFSMSMQVGDTAGGTAPGVRTIVITAE
jgi:hypothetical protein